MPPTEQIFWEAKSRPSSLQDSRRPSTIVDESGCVITRGFILPSRCSSQSSLARSTTSSCETVPSTPASTLEEPMPGFARPTGSLYHALEFKPLRTSSSTSLHPPDYEQGHSRPGLLRRGTWQIGTKFAGRAVDAPIGIDEPGKAALRHHSITVAQISHARRTQVSLLTQQVHMRRTQSEHMNLDKLKRQSEASCVLATAGPMQDRTQTVVRKIVRDQETEDAVASDSEDEEDLPGPSNQPRAGGIAAQRLRPNYAARRAMTDERLAKQVQQLRVLPAEDTSVLIQPVVVAQVKLASQPMKLEVTATVQAEDAIASESEDDEDLETVAALELARVHRERNSISTTTADRPSRLCTATIDIELPAKRSSSADTLTVKIIPPLALEDCKDEETPTEVRSYEIGSKLSYAKAVRPSRSMPRPAKGVLKKPGSRSPSRTVKTKIRRDSQEIVNGIVRVRTPPNPEDERFRPTGGVVKPGAITAVEMRMLAAGLR